MREHPAGPGHPGPAPRRRWAASCSLAAGVLFLVKAGLDLRVAEPPSVPGQLPGWVTSHHLALALTNETLFFAAVLLLPVALGLYRSPGAAARRPGLAYGCALLATAVPVMLVLCIIHGRLVYPVYGIPVTEPTSVALVVSLYYGGAHLVALLLGVALIMLGPAIPRVGGGRAGATFSGAVGALQIAGSFPWLIGPPLTAVCQAMFAGWLLFVGWKVLPRPAG